MRTLWEIVKALRGTLHDLYEGLCEGLWKRFDPKVPLCAYKTVPAQSHVEGAGEVEALYPFFVTVDNGPVHSFWLGRKDAGVHLEHPGCSLLQLLYMSPHGHDQHQIIEHTIGVVKRLARAILREKAGHQVITPVVGCKIMYDAVCEIAGQVSGTSISKGLLRMHNALRQVAAPRGTFLELFDSDGKRFVAEGTAGSYASRA
jgi:hypothetical protein